MRPITRRLPARTCRPAAPHIPQPEARDRWTSWFARDSVASLQSGLVTWSVLDSRRDCHNRRPARTAAAVRERLKRLNPRETLMKSIVSRLAVAALLGISASAAAAAPSFAEDLKLTVVGVGDIYAFEGGKVRGGFARLNAVAKAEKAANPNTLYLFDGDMISPSLLSGLDQGANTIQLTNVVPFDLAVPGNHEFDFGPSVFLDRVKQSKYPWAAINVEGPDGKPIDGVGHDTVMKDLRHRSQSRAGPGRARRHDRTRHDQGLEVRSDRRHRARCRAEGARRRRRHRHRRCARRARSGLCAAGRAQVRPHRLGP